MISLNNETNQQKKNTPALKFKYEEFMKIIDEIECKAQKFIKIYMLGHITPSKQNTLF